MARAFKQSVNLLMRNRDTHFSVLTRGAEDQQRPKSQQPNTDPTAN